MAKHLRFRPLDTRGIPLREVIAVHEQFSRGSKSILKNNLGDGYLFAFNPVFRSVRREFLRLGFRYSEGETQPRLSHYFSFPLMCLDDAIAAGVAPFRNNFYWLKALEKASPGLFTLTELKRSELQFNYLFHESAHFVAHRKYFGKAKPNRIPKTRAGLLRVMLGEAFANATECLSSSFSEGEIGGYLLDANCHFRASKLETRELLRCGRSMGFEKTARVLIASFLYSNFLYEKLSARELNHIRAFSQVEKKIPIRNLVKIGLQLNVQFRTTTTQLHLLKMGFPRELGALMRFDPCAALLKDEVLVARSRDLASLLSRETHLCQPTVKGKS